MTALWETQDGHRLVNKGCQIKPEHPSNMKSSPSIGIHSKTYSKHQNLLEIQNSEISLKSNDRDTSAIIKLDVNVDFWFIVTFNVFRFKYTWWPTSTLWVYAWECWPRPEIKFEDQNKSSYILIQYRWNFSYATETKSYIYLIILKNHF